MDDLTTRPMTAADAPAVQRLLVALEAADRTEEHYSVEDVLEELENPMTGPEDWLLVERAGELVAMSRLLPRAPTGYELLVGIDGGHSVNIVELYDDTVVHSVVPVGQFPQVAGFYDQVLERLAQMTPHERREAFSNKASTYNHAEAEQSGAAPTS